VHQQIRIRIQQILIYKIRIRRKRISAGSVTSLIWYGVHLCVMMYW